MKLIAIVITYYPDILELLYNIQQYIGFVEKLIIWENTPLIDKNNYLISLPEYEAKILYHSTGRNEGIAYPLNWAMEYGLVNGFTHLLTMDQDSCWSNFIEFKQKIIKQKWNNIIAFCPLIESIYDNQHKELEYYPIGECITSGTIYDLEKCNKIGKFPEDYVIDAVDLEYCYRGYKYGYQTIVLPIGILTHKLGAPQKIFNRWVTSGYSPYRTYHIIRNHFWVWKLYPQYFKKRKYLFGEIVYRFFFILFAEKNKCSKMGAIMLGVITGLFCSPSKLNISNERKLKI